MVGSTETRLGLHHGETVVACWPLRSRYNASTITECGSGLVKRSTQWGMKT